MVIDDNDSKIFRKQTLTIVSLVHVGSIEKSHHDQFVVIRNEIFF